MSKENTIEISSVILLVVTGVLILGILCGVLTVKGSANTQEIGLSEFFDVSAKTVFFHSLLRQAVWCVIIFMGALSPFLIPVVFIADFAKGFFYGYTAGYLVRTFALRGFFILCTGVAVHNFLSLSVLTFYASFAVTRSADCWLNRKNYYFKQKQNRILALVTGAVMVLLAFSSLCECATAHLVHVFL